MRRIVLSQALTLLVLVAGCIGAPALEEVDAAEREPEPEASASDAPRPAPAAEPSTPAAAPVSQTASGSDAAGPVELDVPVSWTGRSRVMVCAPRGPDACGGAALPNDERETHAPELPGAPLSVSLVMTLEAESPLTTRMALHAIGLEGCGECAIAGGSPLTLELSGFTLADDAPLMLHAFAPDPCWEPCNGVKTFVDPGQDVLVEGIVRVRAG